MIYCVWYPSGGFGHFVNAVLSVYGENFKRPFTKDIEFSATGTSHSVDLVAPKYFHDPESYNYVFESDQNYSVLIDNGINNEGQKFRSVFPTANIIKLCYTDYSWPVVASTLIHKAMRSNLQHELILDSDAWNSNEDWAVREKYFLFLRDHTLRYQWRPSDFSHNLLIENLDYSSLQKFLQNINIKTEDFFSAWQEWRTANQSYFEPVVQAQHVIDQVRQHQSADLSNIKDIWAQAVVYYYIWITFGCEVPHNTYANFFADTDQITQWLTNQGVL